LSASGRGLIDVQVVMSWRRGQCPTESRNNHRDTQKEEQGEHRMARIVRRSENLKPTVVIVHSELLHGRALRGVTCPAGLLGLRDIVFEQEKHLPEKHNADRSDGR